MRLGLNKGGYFGERIDLAPLLQRIEKAAAARGWRAVESPRPLSTARPVAFRGYERPAGAPAPPRLSIRIQIHGDEPAGPLAAARLLEEDRWPHGDFLLVLPVFEPGGIGPRRARQ